MLIHVAVEAAWLVMAEQVACGYLTRVSRPIQQYQSLRVLLIIIVLILMRTTIIARSIF